MRNRDTAPLRRDWISVPAAAKILGYSRQVIRRMVASGELKLSVFQLPGSSHIRVDRMEVEALIETRIKPAFEANGTADPGDHDHNHDTITETEATAVAAPSRSS